MCEKGDQTKKGGGGGADKKKRERTRRSAHKWYRGGAGVLASTWISVGGGAALVKGGCWG